MVLPGVRVELEVTFQFSHWLLFHLDTALQRGLLGTPATGELIMRLLRGASTRLRINDTRTRVHCAMPPSSGKPPDHERITSPRCRIPTRAKPGCAWERRTMAETRGMNGLLSSLRSFVALKLLLNSQLQSELSWSKIHTLISINATATGRLSVSNAAILSASGRHTVTLFVHGTQKHSKALCTSLNGTAPKCTHTTSRASSRVLLLWLDLIFLLPRLGSSSRKRTRDAWVVWVG